MHKKMKLYKLYIDKRWIKVYIKLVTTYKKERENLKYFSNFTEKRFYIFLNRSENVYRWAMNATIKDVAKRANVSVATVSRVMNGVPTINEEMKERVEKAIIDLDYRPNKLAAGLKKNVTNTIGLVVSDISDSFIIGVTREIERMVQAAGYTLLMASTDNDEKKERESIEAMVSRCVDGLVVCPVSRDIAGVLKNVQCAVASFDRNTLKNVYDTVYVDKEKSTYDAVTYLLDHGHENIALISGEKKLSTNFDRYNGYMRAFFDNDKMAVNGNFMFGTFSRQYGMEAFEKLMARKNPPTAIVSGSASLTHGILVKAKEMGIRIGEDVSLVGFGTLDFQSLIEPQITHAKEMQEEIGKSVGEMVLSRIKNPGLEPRLRVLESAVIEGNTVKRL